MASAIKVPTLGESVTEATIGQWFKKVGDNVAQDEPLVELETDKVTIEVPAPEAGVLSEILNQNGETVEVGAILGMIGGDTAAIAKPLEAEPEKQKKQQQAPAPKQEPTPTPVTQTASEGDVIDLVVPASGESVSEADVGQWFKKVGDTVGLDDAVLELETDKAAMEVPAPKAGTLVEIVAQTGETVEVGALLGRIAVGAVHVQQVPASVPAANGNAADKYMPPAPAAAKLMKENGLRADDIEGTGKRGQILKSDVQQVLKSESSVAPVPESGKTHTSATISIPQMLAPEATAPAPARQTLEEGEERVKMTRLRQTIAKRLKDAQNTAAMLTTFNEVDMSPVMNLRKQYKELFEKKHGVKLGFMGFFTKAVCQALKEIPSINAEIDGQDMIFKNFTHIGVAVGTDKGLVVPVVRHADQMSLAEIEKQINRLGKSARDGQLSMADMQGGTFTISNGGVYGSLMSTPILNAPQSGILGMHKIAERPVVVDGQIVIRPMMYLALSYDHRIVDGKEAVTFLVRVKDMLEDPQRLVLDI